MGPVLKNKLKTAIFKQEISLGYMWYSVCEGGMFFGLRVFLYVLYFTAVGSKPCTSKIVTFQEMEKS